MATAAPLKLLREIASLSWTSGVPNPSKQGDAVSKTFEEALNYLTKIGQLAREVKDKDCEAYDQIKQKSWIWAKQIKAGDQYLKAVAICVDSFGQLSVDKPVMLVFKDNDPFALPYYAKEFLEKESPYFDKLFSGWAKGAKSPIVEMTSISLDLFKNTLQQLDCPWLLQKLNLQDAQEMSVLELIDVIQTGDYYNLPKVSEQAVKKTLSRINQWSPANFKQINLSYELMSQSAKYVHHAQVLQALQQYIDKVSEYLPSLSESIEKGRLEDVQEIVVTGICQKHRALTEALEIFCLKQLEASQDLEMILDFLAQIKNWPIESLTLPGLFLSEESIEQINTFQHLLSLAIQNRNEIESLSQLTSASLKRLSLVRCHHVSKKVLEHLATLPLSYLKFESCDIKDIHLSRLKTYQITQLSLTDCPHLTPSCLAHLLPLPLTHLSIVGCFNKADNLLEIAFLKRMKTLQELTLGISHLKTLAFLQGRSLKILTLLDFHLPPTDRLVDILKGISIEKLILSGEWLNEIQLFQIEQADVREVELDECKKIYRKGRLQLVDWSAKPTVIPLPIVVSNKYFRRYIKLKDGSFASTHDEKQFKIWDKNGALLQTITTKEGRFLSFGVLEDGSWGVIKQLNNTAKIEFWNQKGQLPNNHHSQYDLSCEGKHRVEESFFSCSLGLAVKITSYYNDRTYKQLPYFSIFTDSTSKDTISLAGDKLYELTDGYATISHDTNTVCIAWIQKDGLYGGHKEVKYANITINDKILDMCQLRNGNIVTLTGSKIAFWRRENQSYHCFHSIEVKGMSLKALKDGNFAVDNTIFDQAGLEIGKLSRRASELIDLGYGVYIPTSYPNTQSLTSNFGWPSTPTQVYTGETEPLQFLGSYTTVLQLDENTLMTEDGTQVRIWKFPFHKELNLSQ
jgi:hypothetical protein